MDINSNLTKLINHAIKNKTAKVFENKIIAWG